MTNSISRSRSIAWMVWMTASIFYAYQYILRVMPNIMLEDIMHQFNIDAAAFGQFSGVYYIGYSLMHLPIGLLLDRFGPKKVMTASIFLTVAGLLPLIFSDQWIYPIVGRILIGMGSSAAILGVFKIVRMTFAEAQFSRMLSFSVTIGLIGAIYGGGPVSYMCETWGYQTVIHLIAAAGILLAIATYWIVPDMESVPQNTIMSDIREVLGNKYVIGSCICAGFMVGPLEGFADVWATAFLKNVYGYEGTMAASLPSMIYIGMCFGSPVLSLIADKSGSYLGTIIGAGMAMAACFGAILTWHLGAGAITALFIIVGVCCAYQILAIYYASTYVRAEVAGLTTAVANMIIMIFGYAFHTVIGAIVGQMGGPQESQALIYSMAVVPAALCLGSLGFIILYAFDKAQNKARGLDLAPNLE